MLGRLGSDMGLDEEPHVKEVVDGDLSGRDHIAQRYLDGLVVHVGNKYSPCRALPDFDKTGYLQDSKGLSHHRAAHLKFLGKLFLRGQVGADFKLVLEYPVLNQFGDLLGVPLLFQGGEHHVA